VRFVRIQATVWLAKEMIANATSQNNNWVNKSTQRWKNQPRKLTATLTIHRSLSEFKSLLSKKRIVNAITRKSLQKVFLFVKDSQNCQHSNIKTRTHSLAYLYQNLVQPPATDNNYWLRSTDRTKFQWMKVKYQLHYYVVHTMSW
jgi:hypothetical protein